MSLKAFKHPLDIPIDEVKQAMAQVVKPFQATLQDTTNIRYTIQVKVQPVSIDLQQGKVELEITFTDLKSMSWYKAYVMGDGRNMLNYRKNFFKYWFLLQDGLGQHVDKDSSEANQRFQVSFSNPESVSETYSESNNNLVREIMGMAFEYLCNYAQFVRTIHGLRFEPIDQTARKLYLLKRYFHRKNLLHVNQLFMVQQIAVFEPPLTLPEELSAVSKYGYMSGFQELYMLRSNAVATKNFSRSTTRRRDKLIPTQHRVPAGLFDSDDDYNTQSNFSSVGKHDIHFMALRSSKLIQSSRDKMRASISKRAAGFGNQAQIFFENDANRTQRWTEVVTHEGADITVPGKLIDIPKPLLNIWVRYEGNYYLVKLILGSVSSDEEPDLISAKFRRFYPANIKTKTSLEKSQDESPRHQEELQTKTSYTYRIEDYFAELSIFSRTNELVFSDKVTLDRLPEYLDLQLEELKSYVIRRCTLSILPRELLQQLQSALVILARRL